MLQVEQGPGQSSSGEEGHMGKRPAQFYGYAVCLVTIVASMIAVVAVVDAAFESANPLHSGYGWHEPNLASFENYKMDVLNPKRGVACDGETAYRPGDETLRKMYENEKQDLIDRTRYEALGKMTGNGLLLLACVGLFFFHWRLARRSS